MMQVFKKMQSDCRRIRSRLTQFFIQAVRKALYLYFFSDNTPELCDVLFQQPAQFVGKGKICISGVNIGIQQSPKFLSGYSYFEARSAGSSIIIEDGTTFNNNAVIIADKTQIKIGKRCLIGPDVFITDSDFHGIRVEDRTNGNYICKEVLIGDDVFIGYGVKIMKGVQVGRGSVIGSGSVVINNIPANSICAGVPAKVIKTIKT